MRPMEAHSIVNESRIRDRLIADHRRLDELLKGMLSAVEADDRESIDATFTEFDSRLRTHLDAEERHLIPAFLHAEPRAARALLEEHKHIRARLMELGAAIDLHTLRAENARAFAGELRAHASHEDRFLYKWADEHIGDAERTSLIAALVDRVMSRVRARGK